MLNLFSWSRLEIRFGTALLTFALFTGLFLGQVRGEVWTDVSGKFSVEAEFVGIDGENVKLLKKDGTTITVPLSKLSATSREQARELHKVEQTNSKPKQTTPTTNGTATPPSATTASSKKVSTYQPLHRELNFTPPTPPVIPPALPFPTYANLPDTFAHIRNQALAGHLEVFWEALPEDLRAFLDSDDLRDQLRPFAEKSAMQMSPETIRVVNKLTELLVNKKELILNSQLLNQLATEQMPLIEQAYDPVVGVFFEYTDFTISMEQVTDHSLTDMLHYHLPRLGAHLKGLLQLVPNEVLNATLQGVTVEQTSDTTGTITIPQNDETTNTYDLVLYNDRWLPKEMVKTWLAEKDTLLERMVANASSGIAIGNSPETTAMLQEVLKQIETALDLLLAANTQDEFDTAVRQAMLPFFTMGENLQRIMTQEFPAPNP